MGTVIYLHQHGIARRREEPIASMNITPLIDVMLVLLVMLIITLPMALHKVDVDLPVAGTGTDGEPVTQRLALLSDGSATWNGAAINDDSLAAELRKSAAAKDDLEFRTEANARYERFNQLIALARKSGASKIAFVGNKAFAAFDK